MIFLERNIMSSFSALKISAPGQHCRGISTMRYALNSRLILEEFPIWRLEISTLSWDWTAYSFWLKSVPSLEHWRIPDSRGWGWWPPSSRRNYSSWGPLEKIWSSNPEQTHWPISPHPERKKTMFPHFFVSNPRTDLVIGIMEFPAWCQNLEIFSVEEQTKPLPFPFYWEINHCIISRRRTAAPISVPQG